MPVTAEEIDKAILPVMHNALEHEGITPSYLAQKLKRELNAKEIKAFKASTGKDGPDDVIYSKPLVAWEVRQKARQDAHKLRGDYPADKVDVNLPPLVIVRKRGNGSSG